MKGMTPLIGMKFAPRDKQMFVDNVAELEAEGVQIQGFEAQVLREDTPETVAEAVDWVSEHFDARFRGMHPPFPTFADNEFLKWDRVSDQLGLDYTVMHAAVRSVKADLLKREIPRVVSQARAPVFLENVPLTPDRKNEARLGSLPEMAQLHDRLLMDLPHTMYNFSEGRAGSGHPLKQVEAAGSQLKAAHVADQNQHNGKVPVDGGSPMFQDIMHALFQRPGLFMVAEPTDGHLNGGQGHKDTCRAIWRLWQNSPDSET